LHLHDARRVRREDAGAHRPWPRGILLAHGGRGEGSASPQAGPQRRVAVKRRVEGRSARQQAQHDEAAQLDPRPAHTQSSDG